jgi:hypothetical protein
LKPGGILYFNSTDSPDVVRTVAEAFRHVVMVGTLVAASDTPIGVPASARRAELMKFHDKGRPILGDESPGIQQALDSMLAFPLTDVGQKHRSDPSLRVITEDNMFTEHKRSKHPFSRFYDLYTSGGWFGRRQPSAPASPIRNP